MVVITDTIPEYGRYTYNGLTIIDNSTNNILAKFKYITPIIVGDIDELTNIENTTGKVFIVNSRTHDDLRRIANFIVNNQNVIPVDPLYLISYTAQQYINKPITTRAIIYKSIKRIAFVIGSTQEMTIKQINYASNNGFHAIKLNDLIMSKYTVNNDFIIIHFDYMRDKGLITHELINYLLNFDALVLSGGETANLIFELSGGLYIESITDIMPLVGVGIIRGGGVLDGKLIVTKEVHRERGYLCSN